MIGIPAATRFAPGLTGSLHVGGLANALVNWLCARRQGGRFLVRFDGGNCNAHCRALRDSILIDLDAFGMAPDAVWDWAPRRPEIAERFREWVHRTPEAYACFCSPEEVARRNSEHLRRIDRPEKYPPAAYAVEQVSGVTPEGEVIRPARATASSTARGEFLVGAPPPGGGWAPGNVLTDGEGQWRPWSVGYQGPYDPPCLRVEFEPTVCLHHLEVVFPGGVPRRFRVECLDARGEVLAPLELCRPDAFTTSGSWRSAREVATVPLPGACSAVSSATITLLEAPPWFMVPYHYDGHCAERGGSFTREAKERAMADVQRGVIRVSVPGHHPTAVWFSGMPDLAWYSPVIDQELGITDVWRGRDLIPFAQLEAPVGQLLGYSPRRSYHPLVVDLENVKYSKHAGAARAVGLGPPNRTLGRLAHLLGLVKDDTPRSVDEIAGEARGHSLLAGDVLWLL